MTVVKKIYELQQLDLEIQEEREALEEVERQLGESEALVRARSGLGAEKEHLAETSKRQRDAEWEIEEISSKLSQMSSKLYGGTVKNPKELVGMEQDVGLLKAGLRQKEDTILDIMADVESTQKKIKDDTEHFRILEADWRKGQEILSVR
jgi:predicted  nucleic acid-binding Zn-ribbon protein